METYLGFWALYFVIMLRFKHNVMIGELWFVMLGKTATRL